MSEENENKPTESHLGSTAFSSDVESKLAQIEELEGKIRLLRWGLFAGVLAILTYGIFGLYKVSMKAAQPAIEIFDEAKAIYLDHNETIIGLGNSLSHEFNRTSTNYSTITTHYEEIGNEFDTAYSNSEKIYDQYGEIGTDVNMAFNNAKIIYDQYTEISEDANKAYTTVARLMEPGGPARMKLQSEIKDLLESEIKPAAEDLSKKIIVDIQGEVMKRYEEISAHSDEFLVKASEEYFRLTNNIPDIVNNALENTLLKTITQREVRMRKIFPKLTKEKQTEVFSRLSNFTEEESEKIFSALFADHQYEIQKLQISMNKIWKNEARAGGLTDSESGVETTLALLSNIIEIAMKEYEDLKVKAPDDSHILPEEKEPEAKDKPKLKKKPSQKDKGTSAKNK